MSSLQVPSRSFITKQGEDAVKKYRSQSCIQNSGNPNSKTQKSEGGERVPYHQRSSQNMSGGSGRDRSDPANRGYIGEINQLN